MAQQSAREQIVVESARIDDMISRYSVEDGERLYTRVWYHVVGFRTAYGIDWTLLHQFPDSPAGAAQAARIAKRVQARIDAGGIAALTAACWHQRVVYGSQAYIDDEPAIVQREREDALMGLD